MTSRQLVLELHAQCIGLLTHKFTFHYLKSICDDLRDLVPIVQFKKREKQHGGVLLFKK